MKKLVKTKIASLLAVLMVLSMALPAFAFAQVGFKDLDFDPKTGTVTGIVYSTTDLGSSVNLGVYGPDKTWLNYTTNAEFDSNVNDYVYYTINFDASKLRHNWINFGYFDESVAANVYSAVYLNSATPGGPGGSIGGGFPGTGGGDSDSEESLSDWLREAFAKSNHVTITVEDGYSILLPAATLKEIAEDVEEATLTIVTEAGTYTLPLSVFEYDALAENLDVELSDLDIRIEIKPVADETAEAILTRAEEQGLDVKADAVDFAVTAVTESGDELDINSFGNTFVERSIPLHESVDSDKTTGVVFDPETNEFNFVPSVFAEIDGEDQAIIKRNSNSIYTVVSGDKSFTDIPENHWGKDEIEVLANKLIVAGMTESTFAPNREVTRAEFTALLVRSLGLVADDASETSFDDVDDTAWYAAEVKAAVDAGLVFGYKEDGTFRPNAQISRQEIASLVVRAMAYTGNEVELSDSEVASYLGQFEDSDILHWGQEEMAAAIKAKIVHGMNNGKIEPKEDATRAHAAGLIKRYLVQSEFINE